MLMNWMLPANHLVSERASEKGAVAEVLVPRVDVIDEGDAYQLIVEMPGVSKELLSVHLEAESLLLLGARKAVDEERLLRNGRCANLPFEARFTLGGDVDRGKIRVRLEDGLVHVKLPRREENKLRKIEVEIG